MGRSSRSMSACGRGSVSFGAVSPRFCSACATIRVRSLSLSCAYGRCGSGVILNDGRAMVSFSSDLLRTTWV